jgi:hypothetical protein
MISSHPTPMSAETMHHVLRNASDLSNSSDGGRGSATGMSARH